jgi:chromosome segregation ATPase
MYYLSKAFRTFKYALSLLGLGSSTVIIIYGAISGGIVFIIGGSLCILPSTFIFFENTKVLQDIEKNVKVFKNQLSSLEKDIGEFHDERIKLNGTIKSLEETVTNLDTLSKEFTLENDQLKQSLKNLDSENKIYTGENIKLQTNVKNILTIKSKFEIENNKLSELINKNKEELVQLEKVKNEYIEQLETQTEENVKLKNAISKLELLYNKSREMIKTLIDTKTAFSDLQNDMDNTVEKINITENKLSDDVDKLNSLLANVSERMINSEFNEIDENNDGVITKEEFDQFLQNNN